MRLRAIDGAGGTEVLCACVLHDGGVAGGVVVGDGREGW